MDETLRLWGVNLKNWRTARQLEQSDLAERIGVTQATVSRWEGGKLEPRRHHKVALATALDTDVVILFPLTRSVAKV